MKQIIKLTLFFALVLTFGIKNLSFAKSSTDHNKNAPTINADPVEIIPSFELRSLDDDTIITDQSLKGSYYMIYFWGTSCGPCVRDMPYLHETYEALKDENFEIIAISFDHNESRVREFRELKYPMPWKHTLVGNDNNKLRAVTFALGLRGSPYKIIVSPDGEVLDRFGGFSGEGLYERVSSHISRER
jgi:thiol-disulfide isomerase/thioredoxin